MLVYLWFRFEWQFAVGAVIATLHDLVLTIGFFAITQLEFNLTSIAAILTIVGYSLNDTVVVFDRIRELLRKYKKMPTERTARPFDQLDPVAHRDDLGHHHRWRCSRWCSSAAQVIASFSCAMIFGVVVGTYSSIFIAAPVLIYLGLKVGAKRRRRRSRAGTERREGSGTRSAGRRIVGTGSPAPDPPPMSGGRRYRGSSRRRHIIDAYGNGGFRFAGMSHRGSILALPSGIQAWRRRPPRRT